MAFAPVTPLRMTTLLSRPLPSSTSSHRKRQVTTRQITRAQLIGIPDNLRSDNLEPSPHEVLLAELRFSDPARLPALIENSLDVLDDEFYSFIEQKIKESSDLEERDTLGSLRDAITDLMKQMLETAAASDNPTTVDVSATDVDASGASTAAKASGGDAQSATQSYDEFIDFLVSSYKESDTEEDRASAIESAVNLNYHRIDVAMLERLSERIMAAGADAPMFARVRDTISEVMNERVKIAMESVKAVLSAGSMDGMQKEMNNLSSKGKLDDAFTLLVQANLAEAKKAGATQAISVLTGVIEYATKMMDLDVEPEIRLIRALLRTEDEEKRATMLTEQLESNSPVALPDGSQTMGTKIDGKKFVDALRKLIEEFGNVDEEFVLKLSKIGEESEAVARKVYDMEGKDIEEFQHEAFHKRTVSVWDLEDYEHRETMEGRTAAWEGRLGDIPKEMGFDADGKLSV